jgi:nitrate reductase gamma subunit
MKIIGYGLLTIVVLLGLYTTYSGAMQAREDYSNFRKIVLWVAQKQAQEAEYAKRQAAKQAQAPMPAPAPVQ